MKHNNCASLPQGNSSNSNNVWANAITMGALLVVSLLMTIIIGNVEWDDDDRDSNWWV